MKLEDLSTELKPVTPGRSARKRVSTTNTDDKKLVRKSPDSESGPINEPNWSPKKAKRNSAAPEVYLHPLQDYLRDELDVMFCGVNPGKRSAQVGHHYAGLTNHFWPCLHQSGFTPERLSPTEDFSLPERFDLGLTNLVDRPSAQQADLSSIEMDAAVPAFLAKVARYRPGIVCFVGIGIWRIVERVLLKLASYTDNSPPQAASKKSNGVTIGIQPYKLVFPVSQISKGLSVRETLFFVMPSTSGRVVSHQLNDKVKIFSSLRHSLDDLKLSRIDTTKMHVISLTKTGT